MESFRSFCIDNLAKEEILQGIQGRILISSSGDKSDIRAYVIHVIKSSLGNKIIAYVIQPEPGNVFGAYDPWGDVHLDEGWYEFCITRYKYEGMTSDVGFILSGLENEYGRPQMLSEIGISFPDEEMFDEDCA